MESAFKASVGEPPVQADGTGQHTDDLPPRPVQLSEGYGKNHQSTTEQPRTIAAVLGKKSRQLTHNAAFTLA